MNAKPTSGPWRVSDYPSRGISIEWGQPEPGKLDKPICHMRWTDGLRQRPDHSKVDERIKAEATLIVAAVNACFAINPGNPQAVAEALPDIVKCCRGLVFCSENDERDPCESNRNAKARIVFETRVMLAKLEAKS